MPMPSFPISLLTEKQIKPLIEGKIITDIKYEIYYKGSYSWHKEAFANFDKIKNTKILYADSNFIRTDNGMLVDFGYFDGDLRYFDNSSCINVNPSKKSVTDGYLLTFYFHDNSCMTLVLYSWSTRFYVREDDTDKSLEVIPKSPIEVTDSNAFTLKSFTEWLSERKSFNIIENCSTVKGAFDIYNPVMCYILLLSHIHPRTKTKNLSDTEISELYNNIVKIVNEYKSGERICEFTDIFGNKVEGKNDAVWMKAKILGKPCPICDTLIERTPCAGTQMYFCPKCQVKK